MIYRAAVQRPNGEAAIVFAKSGHSFHRNRSAALRALERLGKKSKQNTRGFLWPLAAGDVTATEIEHKLIPNWVETLAL